MDSSDRRATFRPVAERRAPAPVPLPRAGSVDFAGEDALDGADGARELAGAGVEVGGEDQAGRGGDALEDAERALVVAARGEDVGARDADGLGDDARSRAAQGPGDRRGLQHRAADLAEEGDRLVDAGAAGEAGEREALDGEGRVAGLGGIDGGVAVRGRVGGLAVARCVRGLRLVRRRVGRIRVEPGADTGEQAHGSYDREKLRLVVAGRFRASGRDAQANGAAARRADLVAVAELDPGPELVVAKERLRGRAGVGEGLEHDERLVRHEVEAHAEPAGHEVAERQDVPPAGDLDREVAADLHVAERRGLVPGEVDGLDDAGDAAAQDELEAVADGDLARDAGAGEQGAVAGVQVLDEDALGPAARCAGGAGSRPWSR